MSSEYELSSQDIEINIWISTGAAFLSLLTCSAVLGLAYYVWSRRTLRQMINRVSFRLLMWSMAFEVLYDIAYIAVEFYSLYPVMNGVCASGVYFMISTMSVVNYLCTAIAVNLMLTITFGLNPIKLGLEKWYVGVSILIGMIVPITPAALGHFGYDPVLEVCWIQAAEDEGRMRYFILDLYLWQLLSCFVASISVIVAITTVFRQGRATSAALFAGNHMNRSVFGRSAGRDVENGLEKDAATSGRAVGLKRSMSNTVKRCMSCPRSLIRPAGPADRRMTTMSQLQDKFLQIALQISIYPITLIVVNGIITVGDLYISKEGGVYTKAVYGLYCVYYFLYGGRGLIFAAMAIWIDPCFRRSVGVAWKTRHIPDAPLPQLGLQMTAAEGTKQSFAEMLASSTPILAYEVKRKGSRQVQKRGSDMEKDNENLGSSDDGSASGFGYGYSGYAGASGSGSQDGLVPLSSGAAGDDISLRTGGGSLAITRVNSATPLDMPQALTALALESQHPSSRLDSHGSSVTCLSPRPCALHNTRSFAGVPSGHLPLEMTDDLDIVDMTQSPLTRRPQPALLPPSHTPPSLTGLGVRIKGQDEKLEPLVPDLPDESEIETLRRRVAAERAERRKAERDEAVRAFFEAKAML